MSLTLTENSSDYELVPEGNYIARCFKIIDLGTQTIDFKGETKAQPKILVVWELLDDEIKQKDGEPFTIAKRYTASLNEKATLRKDLQSWRGKRFTEEELAGFNLQSVLGAYCAIQIVHNVNGDKTYANVEAIMSTKEKPAPVNDEISFDLDSPDLDVFETFGEKLQQMIEASPEYQKFVANGGGQAVDAPAPNADDDKPVDLSEIPF